mmetsp:Transcript_44194/g.104020  ORF Transcript_44194/g.104020 Transcript_44194/m.104020 type:complete len:173 (+) Transcript_44194:63-581(+)
MSLQAALPKKNNKWRWVAAGVAAGVGSYMALKWLFAKKKEDDKQHLSIVEIVNIFRILDLNGDGVITQTECIEGLRKNPMIAMKLGMPSVMHEDDGSLNTFEEVFNEIDVDHSKTIELAELLVHYGHTSATTAKSLDAVMRMCHYTEEVTGAVVKKLENVDPYQSEDTTSWW